MKGAACLVSGVTFYIFSLFLLSLCLSDCLYKYVFPPWMNVLNRGAA